MAMQVQWFRDAAFGAFIHWGLYSIPGGIWKGRETDYIGEWLQAKFKIPNAEYEQLAVQFDPGKFDADSWVRRFRDAGMKYIVFTAKHHEGFAMFRTKASPYNVCDASPFGRDPLAELSQACRKYGLKLGIYYSQFLDWHEKDGGDPGPALDNFGAPWGNSWDFPEFGEKNFARYYEKKVVPQVTELLTNYGPVSVIWFDCPLNMEEKFCRSLRELVHSLQPDCLINSRIGHGCEDYRSLNDNQTPGAAIPVLMEAPCTLNNTWGYKKNDHDWKSSEEVIRTLLGCAEKDANLLLNIGPKPDGEFPEDSTRILAEIAKWHAENGEVIHRTTGNPFPQELDFAYVLASEKELHFFPKSAPLAKIRIAGITGKIVSASVPFSQEQNFVTLDFSKSALLQDVRVVFAEKPLIEPTLTVQNGSLELKAPAGKITGGKAQQDKVQKAKADGTLTQNGNGMQLGNGGDLINWENPDEHIDWNVSFPEAGLYQFFCDTRTFEHSHPWVGKRRIELTAGRSVLQAELKPDSPSEDRYYPHAISMIGTLKIETAGKQTVSLRTAALLSEEAKCMGMERIIIKKVGEMRDER